MDRLGLFMVKDGSIIREEHPVLISQYPAASGTEVFPSRVATDSTAISVQDGDCLDQSRASKW